MILKYNAFFHLTMQRFSHLLTHFLKSSLPLQIPNAPLQMRNVLFKFLEGLLGEEMSLCSNKSYLPS